MAHILSLQTRTSYPTVEIDGAAYSLTPADALPLAKMYRLEALRAELAAVAPQALAGNLNEQESAAAERTLDEIVHLVIELPADVFGRLTTVQKFRIAQAFTELPQTTALPAAATTGAMPRPPTGTTSFRASRGSIPGPARSTGSKPSRSRSSGPA